MTSYDKISDALDNLYSNGYTTEFSLHIEQDCINSQDYRLSSDEFKIDKFQYLESDSGEQMILFAISSKKHNIKGTLLNSSGIFSKSNESKIVDKLGKHLNYKTTPLKRANELVQLSREHHHGLLLCWKIKTGLSKNVELKRIIRYVKWFYTNHLIPHFETEEKYIFPLLETNNKNREKAIKEHEQIIYILEKENMGKRDLIELQSILKDHIRFEERILFNEIQQKIDLKKVTQIRHLTNDTIFCDNETDPFWK